MLDIEEPDHHGAMIGRLVDAIRPRDVITWMLIRDLVDHRFEVARYRRMKAELMRHADPQAIEHQIALLRRRLQSDVQMLTDKAETSLTDGPCGGDETRAAIRARLAQDIARRQAVIGKAIDDLEQSCSTEQQLARRFESWAPQQERIDGLLETAERRFRTTLGDLERHLDGFAVALRANLDKIIDMPVGDGSSRASQSRRPAQR